MCTPALTSWARETMLHCAQDGVSAEHNICSVETPAELTQSNRQRGWEARSFKAELVRLSWGLFPWERRFPYLEDEHLSPQDGQSVKSSIADVGFGVGVGRSIPWRQPRRSRLPVWLAGVRGWMGARRGHCRQRLGRLGKLVRRSWKQTVDNDGKSRTLILISVR